MTKPCGRGLVAKAGGVIEEFFSDREMARASLEMYYDCVRGEEPTSNATPAPRRASCLNSKSRLANIRIVRLRRQVQCSAPE